MKKFLATILCLGLFMGGLVFWPQSNPLQATIATETTRNTYSGNGTVFPYTFKIFAKTDLLVIVRDADGNETPQVVDSDYTVSGVGVDAGGNVTFTVAPASTETILILRNRPLKQETDYIEGGPFLYDSHENALDELTMIAQQLQEQLDRSIHVKKSSTLTDLEFSEFDAGEYVRVNLAGDGLDSTAAIYDLGNFLQSGTDTASRTALSKMGEIVSVTDFAGAVGMKINTAVASIGATETTLLIPNNQTLTATLTIPSTLHLWFFQKGKITLGAHNLAINGPMDAPIAQIFDDSGAGTVSFGVGYIQIFRFEWWGAVADDSTDNITPMQNTINTVEARGGGLIQGVVGIYRITSALVNDVAGVIIRGAGKRSTEINQVGTSGENCLEVSYAAGDQRIQSGLFDIALTGNASSGDGLALSDGYYYSMERVRAEGNGDDGFYISGYAYYWNMTDCDALANGGHGCHLNKVGAYQPNANVMINPQFDGNTGEGLYVDEADGLDIFGGSFQSNGNYGIECVTAYAVNLYGGWIENNGTLGIYCPETSLGCVFRPSRLLQDVNIAGTNHLIQTPRSGGLGDIYESTLNNYLSASFVANRHAPYGNELVVPAVQGAKTGSSTIDSDARSVLNGKCVTLKNQNELVRYFGGATSHSPLCLRNGIYKVTVYANSSIGNTSNLSVECRQTTNTNGRLLKSLTVAIGDEFLPYYAGIWTITDGNYYGLDLQIELKKLLDDADEVSISHFVCEPVEPGSIILLSTTTVSLAANGDTTLFTVPAGYRCILDHAKLVAGADAVTSDISIGQNGTETDFVGVTNLDNLDAQYDWVIIAPVPSATPATLKSYAAATVIEAQVANQAGGATNTLYLYGQLY